MRVDKVKGNVWQDGRVEVERNVEERKDSKIEGDGERVRVEADSDGKMEMGIDFF